MEGVKTWLSSQAADFFHTGIYKLIPRYDECLNSGGDYAEKQLKYVQFLLIACFVNSSLEVASRIAHVK
jgi:hypothetical protein